ncbi:hypothetical protein BOX15_Mlig031759g1, partial [Macrostomum lignano]
EDALQSMEATTEMESLFNLYGFEAADCTNLLDDKDLLDYTATVADTSANAKPLAEIEAAADASGSTRSKSGSASAAATGPSGGPLVRLSGGTAAGVDENAAADWRRCTDRVTGSDSSAEVEVSLRPVHRLPPDSRYMFQRYGDCLAAVDAQFDILRRRLLAQLSAPADGGASLPVTAPDEVSHEPCVLIGRVAPPPGAAAAAAAATSTSGTSATVTATAGPSEVDGRLAPPALLLECPAASSGSSIVNVDLSGCEQSRYSLFPGQVVAVRGSNPTGRLFLAEAVLTPTAPPPRQLSPPGPPCLDLAVASGPFDAASLSALLRVCAGGRERPHALLLSGTGWRRAPLFGRVDPALESAAKFCQQRGVQLVVQAPPGPVYPTPELPCPGHGALCVPDPAQLIVQPWGHRLAFTGVDSVAHLAAEEVSGGGGGGATEGGSGDRLGRLAGHLLSQCSMYPLLPSHDSLPLDYPLWGRHCLLGDDTPHLLIAASQVKPFIKLLPTAAVEQGSQTPCCCFVNPGRLSRGTYGRVRLGPDGQLVEAEVLRL